MKSRSPVTTHILDIANGKPAAQISVALEILASNGAWDELGTGKTNTDGRIEDLPKPDTLLTRGTYRLTFHTDPYFKSLGIPSFYPSITIMFHIENTIEHYHVPLLLSPYGYSTYRGT